MARLRLNHRIGTLVAAGCGCIALLGADLFAQGSRIKPGANVFLQGMGGFEADLTVALIASNVPVVIVTDRKDAELEITGRHRQKQGGAFSSKWVEVATITITRTDSGVVLDAYTLTANTVEKLARACAERIQDSVLVPPTAPVAPSPTVGDERPASNDGSIRLFIQGDLNRLADFIQTLRSELQAAGKTVDVVQRGEEYEYNIVFTLADTTASAVVLDRHGVLVASVLDSGFRVKGVTEGAARKLAKRILPVMDR